MNEWTEKKPVCFLSTSYAVKYVLTKPYNNDNKDIVGLDFPDAVVRLIM